MMKESNAGFSILELVVVIAILLLIAAIGAPELVQIIGNQRLQSSAQTYAGFMQTGRIRAVRDNQWYEVLNTTNGSTPIVYVDVNGNGQLDPGEPEVELPSPVVVSDLGVPTPITQAQLGVDPFNLENSPMIAADGNARPGLAFNERGLPCQRVTVAGSCVNFVPGAFNRSTAWVTYLQYPRASGGTAYAAITVTPAGRVKVWSLNNGQWQ